MAYKTKLKINKICLYLASFISGVPKCNYNIDFYIKYGNLLSFDLLKTFKVSQWLGTAPPDPYFGDSILFFGNPLQKILATPLIRILKTSNSVKMRNRNTSGGGKGVKMNIMALHWLKVRPKSSLPAKNSCSATANNCIKILT